MTLSLLEIGIHITISASIGRTLTGSAGRVTSQTGRTLQPIPISTAHTGEIIRAALAPRRAILLLPIILRSASSTFRNRITSIAIQRITLQTLCAHHLTLAPNTLPINTLTVVTSTSICFNFQPHITESACVLI